MLILFGINAEPYFGDIIGYTPLFLKCLGKYEKKNII
jgi:hypothetical protein